MSEKINDLTLKELELSQPLPVQIPKVQEKEDMEKHIQKAFAQTGTYVAYFDHHVHIGEWNGFHFQPPDPETPFLPEALKELRLFDSNCELYLWKTDQGWQGRLRKDAEGKGQFCMDVYQKLWGIAETRNGQSFLKEGRGITISIHPEKAPKPGYEAILQVRGYITELETCQSGYNDFRFVGLVPLEKEV